jgi:hypothetical protein
MVKKAVDTNKTSREELFRAFQVFGIEKDFTKKEIVMDYSYINRS